MLSKTINIRVAQKSDASSIAVIHVASWQKAYEDYIPSYILAELSISDRKQQWENLISNGVKVLVIEKNNLILGFASICSARDPDFDPTHCGEISAIYLNPDVWHKGLGKKLCAEAISELKKLGFSEVIVWVLEENVQARKFYESIGFVATNLYKTESYENVVNLKEVCYRIYCFPHRD